MLRKPVVRVASTLVSRLSNWIGFDDNATRFVCEGPRLLDPDKVVRNVLENQGERCASGKEVRRCFKNSASESRGSAG